MLKVKIPVPIKILAAALPIALLIGGFIFLSVHARQAKLDFYKKEISSIIVSYDTWQKRSVDFYLADSTRLNFFNPVNNKIAVGDSVYKQKNTFQYCVYRKRTPDQYYPIAIYDYRRKY